MDYCWDIDIDKMFNKHKIKYVILGWKASAKDGIFISR